MTCYDDFCVVETHAMLHQLTDKTAGVTNGTITKTDTEQHSRKLNQFFEDQ